MDMRPTFTRFAASVLLLCFFSLVNYSSSGAEEGSESDKGEAICERDYRIATELTWGIEFALGNGLVFAPNAVKDIAIVDAYSPEIWKRAGEQAKKLIDERELTWYAIVEENDMPWWSSPPYQAYEVKQGDIEKIINEQSADSCNIAYLGYLARHSDALDIELESSASEFVVLSSEFSISSRGHEQ